MRIRCMACSRKNRFECDSESEHEAMTQHLLETHTKQVREYTKKVKA